MIKTFSLQFLVLLLILPFTSYGQSICEGSLGTNIFIEGDFGSGNANIISVDPNIAPGYEYTTQMPPFDGFYTITNNSGGWSEIFQTWLRTRDASSDPLGYFMVVNASFSPGIFYEQEITGLCENTQYEFSADIINMIQTGVEGHILPNVAFFLNDEEQFNTGDIPQNNRWITFGFSFTTEPGQTSLKLTLRNNAPGGVGNDLGLDNIRFRACGPLAFILPAERTELCKDDPIIEMEANIQEEQAIFDQLQWQLSTDMGMNWSNIEMANGTTWVHNDSDIGTYWYRYLLSTSPENLMNAKCRIQSDIAEIVILPEEFAVSDTICEGNTLEVDGQIIDQPGDYVLNLISSKGCDSIVSLTLETLSDIEEDAELVWNDPNCFNEASGQIQLLDFVEDRLPYQLSMNGENIEITDGPAFHFAQIDNLSAGSYNFQVIDRYGCLNEFEVVLENPDEFVIDAGTDLDLSLGEIRLLNIFSSEPYSILSWSPSTGLSCTDCPNPELLAIQDQQYILSVLNLNGCEAIDTLNIKVDGQASIYIPNAFSPNDDGFNDYFNFFSTGRSVEKVVTWQIFDRWGTPVFSLENSDISGIDEGWDGRFNGKELDPGVYIYVIQLEFINGIQQEFSGALTLLN